MPSIPEFVGFEHTEDLTVRQVGYDYNRHSEIDYNAVAGFIGQPKCVMDLGCGLGRMAIYVNWRLDNPDTHYILADATEVTHENNISGWNPGRDFYNNMETTKSFCNQNGLTNLTLFDVNRDDVNAVGKIDLLFSFLSIGFHFPIEESLYKFWNCLHPESTLIFGVRHKRYSVQDFSAYFNECYLIESTINDFQKQTRKQHYLILKNPLGAEPPPANIRRGRLLKGDVRWMRAVSGLFKSSAGTDHD